MVKTVSTKHYFIFAQTAAIIDEDIIIISCRNVMLREKGEGITFSSATTHWRLHCDEDIPHFSISTLSLQDDTN